MNAVEWGGVEWWDFIKQNSYHVCTGTWLLLWPCYWSIALASSGSVTSSIPLMALFGCGAILMRGAGCTFNDMVDKDIDVKVSILFVPS